MLALILCVLVLSIIHVVVKNFCHRRRRCRALDKSSTTRLPAITSETRQQTRRIPDTSLIDDQNDQPPPYHTLVFA
ncbi:unnamed protein product, partial [Mesorhabditis belari]|uniref:Secreted protein n=1 Tax=Mesorhabditis belari TaxID=2138241 RepID=A0AAF3JC78_9BILA